MSQRAGHDVPQVPSVQDRLLGEIARSEAALLPVRLHWQRRYAAGMRTAFVSSALAAGVPQLMSVGTAAARTQVALTLAVVAAGAAAGGGVAWFSRRNHLAREARAQALLASLATHEDGACCDAAAAGYLAALNNRPI